MATTVIVNFNSAKGKEELLHQELQEIVEVLKTYQKCHSAELFLSEDEPGVMMIVEEWESSEDHGKFYNDLKQNGALEQISKLFSEFSFKYFEKADEKI